MLILLTLFIFILIFFIFIGNNYPNERFSNKLQENDSLNNNSLTDEKVCISKYSEKGDMLDAVNYLVTNLKTLNINYRLLRQKVDKLYDFYQTEISDREESNKTIEKNAKEAKESFTKDISKKASLLSGVSPKKAADTLNKHFSKTISFSDLDDFIKDQKPISSSDIMDKNKRAALKYDQIYSSESEDDSSSIAGNYMDKSKVKLKCDNDGIRDEELEKSLVDIANNQAFSEIETTIEETCDSEDKDCREDIIEQRRKLAKSYLKSSASVNSCKISNPDGLFPFNIKEMNRDAPKGVTI